MGDLEDSRIIMAWSVEEKTYVVEKYFIYFKYESFVRLQRDFRTHFGCRNVPGKKMINLWVKKFRELGTVQKVKTDQLIQAARPKSVRILAKYLKYFSTT